MFATFNRVAPMTLTQILAGFVLTVVAVCGAFFVVGFAGLLLERCRERKAAGHAPSRIRRMGGF